MPLELRFTIPLPPRTKKNHQQIKKNRKTGGRYVGQSKVYEKYEKDSILLIPATARLHIKTPANIKALYYMDSLRRVDITNLNSALHDILVQAGVLDNDSSINPRIVAATDGSRVYVDQQNPRTEVIITAFEEAHDE